MMGGRAGGQFAHHGNKRTTYFHSQPQSAGFDRDLPFLHIEKKKKNIQKTFFNKKKQQFQVQEFMCVLLYVCTFQQRKEFIEFYGNHTKEV